MTTSNSNDSKNGGDEPPIKPELSKKLLQIYNTPEGAKRIPADTAKAVSELLRLFIIEARSRASIEVSWFQFLLCSTFGALIQSIVSIFNLFQAECDLEGAMQHDDDAKENAGNDYVPIRADHVTKIAAELLMDFS